MSDLEAYEQFVALLVKDPDATNGECIAHTMRAMGGKCDPNVVTEWWQQWQILRTEMERAKDGKEPGGSTPGGGLR